MNDQNPDLWRILLVDDDEDDSILVRSMLQEAQGQKVALDWAPSYTNGQDKLQTNHYDAVLVDYDLGLHTGIELIRQTAARGYPAPLILYTGRGTYDVDLEAMQAGATLYLSKGEANALLLERVIRYAIERKQVEEALVSSNRRISEVLSSITDDFYVLDRDWKFVYANKQLTGKVNKEAEDFIGHSIWEMFPKHVGSVFYENFHASMEKGEKRRFEVRGEYTDSWYSMTSFPSAEGITVLGTDITERKRAEAALRESEQRFRALVTASSDVVYCMSPDWTEMRFLRGHDFIPDTEEPSTTWLDRYIPPKDQPRVLAAIQEAIRTKSIFALEHQVLTVDGSLGWTFSRAVPILDANGEIVEWFGTASDITERKRAEEENRQLLASVKQEKARLQSVMNNIPDEVWFVDTSGSLVMVNEQVLKAFGPGILGGQDAGDVAATSEVYRPDGTVRPPEEAPPLRALRGEQVRDQDEIVRTPATGELRHRQVNAVPVKDEHGRLLGSVSIVRDVTEHKQAEKALQESEERLRDFLESTHDSIFILDREWRFQYANRRFAEIQGKSVDELLGKDFWETFPRYLGTPVEEHYRKAMTDRVPATFEIGGVYSNAWYEVSLYPTREGLSVFAADRTSTKLAGEALQKNREALQRSEEKFARAFRSSPVAIAISTVAEGRFLEVNDSYTDLYGFSREELIGHTSIELGMFPNPEDRQEIARLFRQGGGFRNYEIRLLTKSGEPRDVLFSTEAVDIEGQECMLSLVVDFTERKQVEEALRESEQRFRALFHNRHSPMLLIDPATFQIVDANPAACSFYGWSPEQMVAMKITDINILPVDQTRAQMDLAQAASTSRQFQFRHRLASGEIRDVEVNSGPIQVGQQQYLFSIIYDITERLQTEQALRLSEERFNKAFDASPTAMVISRVEDGHIQVVNDSFTKLFGYRQDEVIGKTSLELGMFADPADRQEAIRILRETQTLRDFEIAIRTRSGKIRHVSLSVVMLDVGDEANMLTILQDITERKQAEKALHENLNRLRRIFETSVIGIVERNVEGSILSANEALMRMLGYSREEFLVQGRSVYDLLPEEYHAVEREIVEEVLATGSSRPHDKEFLRKDGSRLPVLVGHTLLEGDPAEIIGFVVDLSELKQTQAALQEYTEKLRRSNQELEQFAFVASHDLQEPLRKIKLFGNSLEQKLGGDLSRDARDTLTRMQKAAGRMQKMIDGLLDLSRVNTRGGEFEAVPLTLVAQEAVSDLEARLRASRGRVEVGELPAAEVDVLLMRRLFQNLIGNALKFHKPEAPPVVRVAGKVVRSGGQQWAQITVADNGIGFDEANAEHLFEPFQRLHSRDQFEGTGMGLAICRKIVERHGGRITAQSTPGQGSTFCVILPIQHPVPDRGEAHG